MKLFTHHRGVAGGGLPGHLPESEERRGSQRGQYHHHAAGQAAEKMSGLQKQADRDAPGCQD